MRSPSLLFSLVLAPAILFAEPARADGPAEPSPPAAAAPELVLATAEEEAAAVGWLKEAGHAFDPSAYDAADLAPLVERLGGARIIGIGEATHGGHQDQAFKAELIKALVRAGKVDVLMLEANREAAAGFDHYIRQGQGDPAALVRSRSFFATWKDDEFAGLVLWLRAWNLQAAHPVRVVGVDCQDSGRDAAFALDFIAQHDAKSAEALRPPLASLIAGGQGNGRFIDWFKVRELAELDSATSGVRALDRWFAAASASIMATPGFTQARIAARAAVQGFEINKVFRKDFDESKATEADYSLRDVLMAENATTMLGKDERAVLWAHDLHVLADVSPLWREGGYVSIGMLLRKQLADAYRTVGFTWSEGGFWASRIADTSSATMTGQQKPEVLVLANNRPGELGSLFDQTGARAMWADFAARPSTPQLDSWAKRPYWRGWAGWGAMPDKWQQPDLKQGYLPADAGIGFDVVVWFRSLSPARRWTSGQAKPETATKPPVTR